MRNRSRVIEVILDRWDRLVTILDFAEDDPVCKVLRAKLNSVSIFLSGVITDHLLYYCSLCSCEDVNLAEALLCDIIIYNLDVFRYNMQMNKITRVQELDLQIINGKYPIMSDSNIKQMYKNKWYEGRRLENLLI